MIALVLVIKFGLAVAAIAFGPERAAGNEQTAEDDSEQR
jgi:hypothetical protein